MMMIMKFLALLMVCSTIIVVAEQQESKFQEIIQLLNNSEQQLKAEAQTYSASVADPNSYSQGYSRASERSRYLTSSQPTSSSNAAIDDEESKKLAEEEDEKKPDRLALLLAESKFTCDALRNGYYADETVGCQVFHYCIDGVKHSWQCPENTVFHQIHLNCVPNTQDICQQSSKYHIVNEYLHKELEERGPNNTVLYHQRFYPDGFDYSGGDPVAQIFQAQAQAAILKAQQGHRTSQPIDDDDDEEEPLSRPRTRSRQQYSVSAPQSQAQVRSQMINKPIFRQPSAISRPLVSYSPQQQSKPTSRPLSFTSAPETFAPPTYTESPQDDFDSNDYSHPSDHSSSSLQSGFQPSNQIPPSSFNVPSSSSFQPPSSSSNFQSSGSPSSGYTSSGSASGYTSSGSSSSYSPSSSSQNGFRSTSSSSRSSNYPTRSLGIPIASFRVAPASSFTASSSPTAQASSIQEVNVAPLISFTSLSNNHDENQQILSHLFY